MKFVKIFLKILKAMQIYLSIVITSGSVYPETVKAFDGKHLQLA